MQLPWGIASKALVGILSERYLYSMCLSPHHSWLSWHDCDWSGGHRGSDSELRTRVNSGTGTRRLLEGGLVLERYARPKQWQAVRWPLEAAAGLLMTIPTVIEHRETAVPFVVIRGDIYVIVIVVHLDLRVPLPSLGRMHAGGIGHSTFQVDLQNKDLQQQEGSAWNGEHGGQRCRAAEASESERNGRNKIKLLEVMITRENEETSTTHVFEALNAKEKSRRPLVTRQVNLQGGKQGTRMCWDSYKMTP
ncbi:hypothetical protein C8R44DRAFT_754884 [Mycena epipterygia]|nr:hypothetical protein C8R44DRAFT_754884 [Mycena epipterygia]